MDNQLNIPKDVHLSDPSNSQASTASTGISHVESWYGGVSDADMLAAAGMAEADYSLLVVCHGDPTLINASIHLYRKRGRCQHTSGRVC